MAQTDQEVHTQTSSTLTAESHRNQGIQVSSARGEAQGETGVSSQDTMNGNSDDGESGSRPEPESESADDDSDIVGRLQSSEFSPELEHPVVWARTGRALEVSERSPYEDYDVARPHFSQDRQLYSSWVSWTRERVYSRIHSPAPPPAQFSRFKLLPPELRLKVLGFALPTSRVARIEYHAASSTSETARITTELQNPVLLAVCREARALALRHYTIFPNLTNSDTGLPVYFDFEVDIFFPSPLLGAKSSTILCNLLREAKPACLAIKRVALLLNDLDIIFPTLSLFTQREEVLMVLTDGKDEFAGENGGLRLEEIELPKDTEGPADGISDILDMEMSFFRSKWDERVLANPRWKAPRLAFATLENEKVTTPSGMIRYSEHSTSQA